MLGRVAIFLRNLKWILVLIGSLAYCHTLIEFSGSEAIPAIYFVRDTALFFCCIGLWLCSLQAKTDKEAGLTDTPFSNRTKQR